MNKPLTTQQKSARRNLALNEIARRLGFESWRKLETQIKKGRYVVIPLSKWIKVDDLQKETEPHDPN